MTEDWTLTRTFASEQGEIRWDRLGKGPAVVLVHGTPFSSYVWRDVARALARRFTVYVWDLAGYGESVKTEGQDVTLAAQGRILAALLEHWQLETPLIAGHDFGGGRAAGAPARGPSVRASRLLDAVALAPWGTGFFQLATRHDTVLTQLPEPVHEGLVTGYVRWAMRRAPTPEVVDRLAAPWLGEAGKAALYRQISQNGPQFTDELEPHLATMNVPTLVLWGEDDAWLPLEQGRALAGRIPGARFAAVPGAGHLVQHDAPAIVALELFDFLSA